MDVRVHWNFHKRCYSVVNPKTGRVIEHTTGPLYLLHARFVVQSGGRARVLRTKRKNVHSYVRGSRIAEMPTSVDVVGGGWPQGVPPMPVHYDPYVAGYWWWISTDNAVDSAIVVELTTDPETQGAVVNTWGPQFCWKEAA